MKKYGFSRKTIVLVLAFVMTALTITGCGQKSEDSEAANDAPETLATVNLGVTTGNQDYLMDIVAREKGIYEKNGLDVKPVEYANGVATVDAITTGQIDIGIVADFGLINRLGNTEGDSNLRITDSYMKSTNYSLYVNPETVASVEDLKGKRFMTMAGTVWDYWNSLAYTAAGITEDDVTTVAIDSPQSALAVAQAGDADAFWTEGENAARFEEQGWKAILSQEDANSALYTFHVSTQEYLENNGATVENFLKATQDTMDYIKDNEDEVVGLLNEKTGIEESVIKNQLEAVELTESFKQDVYDHMYDLNAWAVESGLYSKEYVIADYINTDALSAVLPESVDYSVK